MFKRLCGLILVLSILASFLMFPGPVLATTISFTSSTSDGYCVGRNATYSTARTDATAYYLSASATAGSIGQQYATGEYWIYRGFVYFDTSSLGAGATISSATLKLYAWSDSSSTDFDIVVSSGMATYPHDPFVSADYNRVNYSGDGGSINTSIINLYSYNSIALNGTGLGWINKTGITKFALLSSRDITGTQPTGTEMVGINMAESGTQPTLEITYVVDPSITAKAATNVSLTSAKLNATVDSDGGDTTCQVRFGYGTVTHIAADFESYTTKTAWVDNYHTADNPFVNVTSLAGSTVYYYRAQVKNTAGTVTSTNEVFFDTTDQYATLNDWTVADNATAILISNPLMPPQMYTELDTSKVPGGTAIDEILNDAGLPGPARAFWWYPLVFGLIAISSLIIYGLTAKNADGSLLLQCIVIEAGLVLFGLMGIIGTSSLIPLWPAFLFPISAIAWTMAKKQFGW